MKLRKKRSYGLWALVSFVGVVSVLSVIMGWYAWQLRPVANTTKEHQQFIVEKGDSSGVVAKHLQAKGVIRSELAFRLYVYLHHLENTLQAGTYQISTGWSTPDIAKAITSGAIEQFTVTFLPGGTLEEHTKVLQAAGYTREEIDRAYAVVADHPLLASRPKGADLEGYLYGETYKFGRGTTAEEVVRTVLDAYYKALTDNQLLTAFTKQGLTLHQAITLASIVQREVTNTTPSSVTTDQRMVAQVFYSRLRKGDKLGSDVTYQYIADKTGQARSPGLDSPYNTRRYPGLPPGPIASPGLGALLAVAQPAHTDYYFFLSGDDNKTYFARTNTEHERNIRDHCRTKCQIL